MVANYRKRMTAGLLTIGLSPISAFAQRYNTETQVLPPPTKEEIKRGRAIAEIPANASSPKEWAPLLNPAYEEFWAEGNFKPDAGFLLFARNPTPENAKNWLLRMETKARVMTKMYALAQAAQVELIKSGKIDDRYNALETFPRMNQGRQAGVKEASALPKDVVVYFIYRPECGACHALAKMLAPIKDQVQALQAPLPIPMRSAGEALTNIEGLNPSTWADADTMRKHVSRTVPVVLIYSKTTNQVTKLDGPRSLQQIIAAAAYVTQKG